MAIDSLRFFFPLKQSLNPKTIQQQVVYEGYAAPQGITLQYLFLMWS